MWLAKKFKTFVFRRLPVPFMFIALYAVGLVHVTLALYLVLSVLLIGWLPTKIGWLTAKALFPSLPARCDVESWRWHLVVLVGLFFILTILLNFLFYYHLGVPEWTLLIEIDIDPQPWRHGTFIAAPISGLIAGFAIVLFSAWRLQKKKWTLNPTKMVCEPFPNCP